MCPVEDQPHEREIVAAESGGFFPDVTVTVQANNGDAVPDIGPSSFLPDTCLDQADADFMDGSCHCGAPRLDGSKRFDDPRSMRRPSP